MTHLIRAFALSLILLPTFAQAADITIKHPWARASAGMAKAGGAFMTIKNAGHAADKLVAAKADISGKVELHTHIKDGDVMRMRQVPHIDVPAMGKAVLQPGGLHVMFMGLKNPLKEGSKFPLTLVFEKAGEMTVDVTVKGVGAMGAGHKHDMKGMKHDMKNKAEGAMKGQMKGHKNH